LILNTKVQLCPHHLNAGAIN